MRFIKLKFFLTAIIFASLIIASPAQAATNLAGRIFLQVQDRGQAWYISPTNNQRYFLGTPSEALKTLGKLGLGVSNRDFARISKSIPSRLLGRIIIKVEDKGQAYYLDPLNHKLYPLEKPADVSSLIKSRGLGITNANLGKIVQAQIAGGATSPKIVIKDNSAPASTPIPADFKKVDFTWSYQNKTYFLSENFSNTLYKQYTKLPKAFTYNSSNPPLSPRDSFYQMLISTKSGDTTIDKLLNDLKVLATKDAYQGDQLAEFVLAFVQYIPYDHAKAALVNNEAYYPYETLYKNTGVCSDKSFLAALLLKRLGYGTIIFDFPDANHSAVGIQCPVADSTYQSGYCYVETTNYFPVGILPQSLNGGIASNSADQITQAFNTANLGKMESYQKTSGTFSYGGIKNTKAQLALIQSLEIEIDNAKKELNQLLQESDLAKANLTKMKAQLDGYQASGNFIGYNLYILTYNPAVIKYNQQLVDYQSKVDIYNEKIIQYNQTRNNLFQK